MNEIIDQNKEFSTTKINSDTIEKKLGKKHRKTGAKLLIVGIVIAVIVVVARYVMPWIWDVILRSMTPGIIGPFDQFPN
jgi:preprotein translocase subunit SecF